jgi:hypothetical protein
MSFVQVSQQVKASLASVAALFSVLSVYANPANAAGPWPARVHASYDIDFNGLSVGTFDFTSSNDGQTYSLSGNGKLSLLLGAFRWQGETRTTGKLSGDITKPQNFAFGYKGSTKSGSTRMSFANDTVTSVLHEPPSPPKPGTVPVLPEHLKGVLDPLTAMMAVSGASLNPCSRRIPIYDGKARFDLVLSPRGMVDLREQRPSGQPGQGHVCRVKYIPIAGHKADEESKFMAATDGIELILRPIPSANVFVPYKITVPTGAGPATLTSRRVDIVTSQHQQIALVH